MKDAKDIERPSIKKTIFVLIDLGRLNIFIRNMFKFYGQKQKKQQTTFHSKFLVPILLSLFHHQFVQFLSLSKIFYKFNYAQYNT